MARILARLCPLRGYDLNHNFVYVAQHCHISYTIPYTGLSRVCRPKFNVYCIFTVRTSFAQHIYTLIFVFVLLFYSKVTPGGKADLQGILEGDLIDEINNEPTEHLVHLDAQNLIKSSKDVLRLLLIR